MDNWLGGLDDIKISSNVKIVYLLYVTAEILYEGWRMGKAQNSPSGQKNAHEVDKPAMVHFVFCCCGLPFLLMFLGVMQ